MTGVLDFWTSGLPDFWTSGLPDFWPSFFRPSFSRLLSSGLLSFYKKRGSVDRLPPLHLFSGYFVVQFKNSKTSRAITSKAIKLINLEA
jgi:hypothetical protein